MLSMTLALLLSQTPKLAAPSWTAVEVSPEKAQFFALHLSSALRDRGLSVISSQDIATLLGVERQKQLLGCAEDSSSCMVELAGALGAQLVLSGSIAKLETTYQVNLRVLQSSDGKVVAQQVVRAESQEQLLVALDDAAASLARQLASGTTPGSAPKASSLAWIPVVGAGVFAVLGGVFLGLASARSAELDAELLRIPTPARPDLDFLAQQGVTMERLAWGSFAVAGAAGVTAVLMFLLGAPPPATVSVTPMNGGAVVGVRGAL
ncbi:MAG: hypothetical protein Q8S33_23655 [Myxococcales bacterium]|nr:hypothetical protein [Myxococcales bacterium]